MPQRSALTHDDLPSQSAGAASSAPAEARTTTSTSRTDGSDTSGCHEVGTDLAPALLCKHVGMVALRSSRLEGLFGGPLGAMTHASVASLVPNGVVESYDLEFKGQIYGRSDKEKRDLAGDVAALANTAGGVILLGIEEDDQARACAAPGVPLSDAEVGRMRQVVASQVSPLPLFDVLPGGGSGAARSRVRRARGAAQSGGAARGSRQRGTALSTTQRGDDHVPVGARGGARVRGTPGRDRGAR